MNPQVDPEAPPLSVVIPVHNGEKHLLDCLGSLGDQSLKHFEAIVVDDGSTDGSLDIAMTFARHDPRFTVISTPNGGVSRARNAGLRAARGTYVTFVDADDWVDRSMYEDLLRPTREYCYDAVASDLVIESSRGGYRVEEARVAGGAYDAERIEREIWPIVVSSDHMTRDWPYRIVTKLYRREHLLEHDLWFVPDLAAAQDFVFSVSAMVRADSLYYVKGSSGKLVGGDLIGTAFTDEGILMALRHSKKKMWGVQFHPESILTEYGHQLLRNFQNLTRSTQKAMAPVKTISIPRSRAGGEVPVQFRKLSDGPSAESVFAAMYADKAPSAWLDSSSIANGLARFSFIADTSNPADYVLRYRTDDQQLEIRQGDNVEIVSQSIFEYLRDALAETRTVATGLPFDFCGGFVGYFGYELKSECGGQNRYRSDFPDAWFLRISRFIAFDHLTGDSYIVTVGNSAEDSEWIDNTEDALRHVGTPPDFPLPSNDTPWEFTLDQDHREYVGNIQRALKKIRDGESYQVCLTNRMRAGFEGDPFELYRILRRRNPAPFSAFLNDGDFAVLSSSPERFMKISPGGLIEARPMKGTIRRSADPYEDVRLASALASSEKNRAENLMIVDLLRNDLGRVSKVGSVRVPALMAIESYATVHQMVSSIQAELSEGHDRINCIKAAFPGGSMTGAPKIRTMKIIDSLESSARGIYSGALGYLSFNGAVDLSIAIRTIVASSGGLSMGVGGGIVALSDPEEEFQEALLKGKALIDAAREYQTIRADQRV